MLANKRMNQTVCTQAERHDPVLYHTSTQPRPPARRPVRKRNDGVPNKRDVKDGKDEDLTAEPEQIRAFRDTWELGIHSYLTYLRDRLLLARELLIESGSIFVQISDENVHHVRELMDEVFGAMNFISVITTKKKWRHGAALY